MPTNLPSVLLVGNGPVILNEGTRHGSLIDAFNGKVVRFNNYVTNDYTSYVGTRTDWWCTAEAFSAHLGDTYERVICSAYYGSQGSAAFTSLVSAFPSAERIAAAHQSTGYPHPSTGAMLVRMLLAEGRDVWLTGFDHFIGPRYHYWRTAEQESTHVPLHQYGYEAAYFYDLTQRGLIRYFGSRGPVSFGPSIQVNLGSRPTLTGSFDDMPS
jgi:hypothetical protein